MFEETSESLKNGEREKETLESESTPWKDKNPAKAGRIWERVKRSWGLCIGAGGGGRGKARR